MCKTALPTSAYTRYTPGRSAPFSRRTLPRRSAPFSRKFVDALVAFCFCCPLVVDEDSSSEDEGLVRELYVGVAARARYRNLSRIIRT